jgi:alpha,alpha-trehalose phosphorylase
MHIASLASVWTALVAGFGGLREYQGQLSFAPQLPDNITRLSFIVQWRGLRLEVDIEPGRATYGLRDRTDSTLAFRHHGEEVTVTAGKPVTALIGKRPPLLPCPPQPPGREPLHKGESQKLIVTSRSARKGRKKVSLDEGAIVRVKGDGSSASSPLSR